MGCRHTLGGRLSLGPVAAGSPGDRGQRILVYRLMLEPKIVFASSVYRFTTAAGGRPFASARAISQASLAVSASGLFQGAQISAIQVAGEGDRLSSGAAVLNPSARLVLLYSWTFTCEGDGTSHKRCCGARRRCR